MKQMITLLMTLLTLQCMAQGIAGKVQDDKKELLINATVQVFQGGILKGGAITDYDGKYVVKPLDPGYYDVIALYAGYDSFVMKRVVVAGDNNVILNITMKRNAGSTLRAVTVTTYRHPLIDRDNPGSSRITINRMPTQQTSNVSTTGGVYESQRQQPVYFNPNTESYSKVNENDFRLVAANPLSTMSVDVDRASYSNMRRFVNSGYNPPTDAVRIEEMINYFSYNYPQPTGDAPIAINTELTSCPWDKEHKLLRVGIQARKANTDNLPPSNLVFLIDVSGSMAEDNKLPLLIEGLKLLVNNLRPIDKVAIVTYAGNAGLVLPSTNGSKKQDMLDALDRLSAGGSTAGGAGIMLAYKVAQENFIEGGNNRVILATDGDFNVGVSNDNELEELISKKRSTGVYLTCLGVGTGNYKDSKMETLADKGNGNYSYLDDINEARKVLISEFGGTLFTVAKDVKAQIEFNPTRVASYRVVGYENRMLNNEDFKDDKKDAGDMGTGHTVTILYEIIPAGVQCKHIRSNDSLKYQVVAPTTSTELATVKFRYKKPDENNSKEIQHIIPDVTTEWDNTSDNTRFPAAVAIFGMVLSDSKYATNTSYDEAIKIAKGAMDNDKDGYREEFVKLVKKARSNDK